MIYTQHMKHFVVIKRHCGNDSVCLRALTIKPLGLGRAVLGQCLCSVRSLSRPISNWTYLVRQTYHASSKRDAIERQVKRRKSFSVDMSEPLHFEPNHYCATPAIQSSAISLHNCQERECPDVFSCGVVLYTVDVINY